MSPFLPLARLLQGAPSDDAADHAAAAGWDAAAAANDGEGDRTSGALDGGLVPAGRSQGAAAPLDDSALAGLIGRIERRDAHALQALYELAGARIYGFVHRFMRRHALTEEVVEDTFWQVWRQAPRFDLQRGRALTWLLAMARSRAIDALRREHRFQCEPLAIDDAQMLEDERALDLLEAAQGAGQLHRALAALEPRGRQLLALAFFRGLTHEEIATHTALPLGTVKSAIRRALLQLREQLQARPSTAPVSARSVP